MPFSVSAQLILALLMIVNSYDYGGALRHASENIPVPTRHQGAIVDCHGRFHDDSWRPSDNPFSPWWYLDVALKDNISSI